ncbi:MAG: hypothetical protein HQL73_04265 [Magnetococcales bacterium]|nr:hypothetical protein [Magnetococcales bacterium]
MPEAEQASGKKLMLFKQKSLQDITAQPLGPPWTIIVVDDDRQVHILTEEVLKNFIFEGRPIQLFSGFSGQDAQKLLQAHPDAAVILLDVVMETNHAGLEVVKFIRGELENKRLRILLRTGQAGQFPEEKIFEEYDINHFLEKTDLTSRRLKMTIKVALRSYRDISELDQARRREVGLRQAADAASQSKTNFLHMMSHELRTPLQGAKGPFEEFKLQFHLFSGMKKLKTLIAAVDDAELQRRLSSAVAEINAEVESIAAQGLKSVRHLLGLIEDILDFARIEAGKLTLSVAPCAVQSIVSDVVDIVRPLVERKKLLLETHLQQDITVLADAKRLKQILLNLMGNAIKFTAQGSVSLTVTRDGDLAVFVVMDTGEGIPMDKLEVIFNAFEQADNSTTRQSDGTGLGLPITRELIRKHGGDIHVKSTPGQGSIFDFSLPLATPSRHV